ncbi:unnamed protein product, partial [Nesidiocoris tenuis]
MATMVSICVFRWPSKNAWIIEGGACDLLAESAVELFAAYGLLVYEELQADYMM